MFLPNAEGEEGEKRGDFISLRCTYTYIISKKEGEKGNEEAQNRTWEKTQEAAEEFQRKVARYYGLEEEAVRITWKDD